MAYDWDKIAKACALKNERIMFDQLYNINGLSFFRMSNRIRYWTGETIAPDTIRKRMQRLGFKFRPRGGANNIKTEV